MQQFESLCKSSVLAVGTFVYKNRCKDTKKKRYKQMFIPFFENF